MDVYQQLCTPFPSEVVSWRVGSTNGDKTKGLALAYIDARDVMARLDDVMGPQNWQCRYTHAEKKTICEIGVKFDGEWIWKADGAGDSDVEAEKGAISDAFKRAAVKFGVGRYLYDVPSPWVAIEAKGKSYTIKNTEYAGLRALLDGKPRPKTAPTSETKAEPSTEDKANAAVAFAQGCVKVFKGMVDEVDKGEFIDVNWPKISACVKYPAAAMLLIEAGLVVEGSSNG